MASNLGATRVTEAARRIELGAPAVEDVRECIPDLKKALEETNEKISLIA
jgi:hypothetical protein